MKINQVEELVGIKKKNIRFYEDQDLIHPSRNSENGYRDYSEADVETLLKIKLLRKLSVPIEEIRKMQTNHLSLSDCLDRHLIFLTHEERNLNLMKEMCDKIKQEEDNLTSLNADVYLKEMQLMEEGGIRFMDIDKNDIKKKKSGSTIASAVMIIFMIAFAGLLIWAQMADPLPIWIFMFILIIPIAIVVGVLLALRQRFNELEGGEENEASKY